MIFHLALLNIKRNFHKLAATGAALVIIAAALTVANAVLAASGQRFRALYADNFSGELVVKPADADGFTIFGHEELLVGGYLVPPTLVDAPALIQELQSSPEISHAVGLVSGAAQTRVEGVTANRLLLGVDMASYLEAFPSVQLVRGSASPESSKGLYLQEDQYQSLADTLGYEPPMGAPVLLSTAYAGSFAIREVPLAGTVAYPYTDQATAQVVLVDAPTVRALNGYVYGSATAELPDEVSEDLISTDVDDLFGGTSVDAAPPESAPAESNQGSEGSTPDAGVSLDDIDGLFQSLTDESGRSLRDPVEGAWSFILIRTATGLPRADIGPLASEYELLDWRQAVGGVVRMAGLIQLAMNAGLIFIVLAAVTVAANGVALAVLERSREIGTLRALGAGRSQVAVMVVLELGLFVTAAALLGVALGVIGAGVLEGLAPGLSNPLLQQLFGGPSLAALVTPDLVIVHVVGAAGLALVSALYPVRRVLSVSPLRAMAGDRQID